MNPKIVIKQETYNKISELRSPGQTFDGVIQELLIYYTTFKENRDANDICTRSK